MKQLPCRNFEMNKKDKNPEYTLENAEQFIGKTLGVSDWHVVSQENIKAFGDVTFDPDPNHVDPDWARENSPYGFPIAFGFQTLALLTFLCKEAGIKPGGVVDEYNYGFDSVRFIAPVPAGSRIRAHCNLKGVRVKGQRHKVLIVAVEVEVEGGEKPALVADWLAMCGGELDEKQEKRV
jgi:acyl dehydratase